MRTRNMRTEQGSTDSKAEQECNNSNIATNTRVSRRDAKSRETEARAKEDSEKVSKEKALPPTRETRSRNRESRAAETISTAETRHPSSKSVPVANNSRPPERMIDGCSGESGTPSKTLSNTNITCASSNGEALEHQSEYSEVSTSRQFNMLIAATGSVATVKLIELIETLTSHGRSISVSIHIKLIMTENAKHFTAPDKIIETFNGSIKVHDDKEEWNTWNKIGDDILHIELRKWADIFLIAPLDANTMGKLANGICDNLLTCTARAWDTSKPLIFCPAMNVHMYEHPLTRKQIAELQSFGYTKIDCIAKKLACGDIGMGAMASVDTIVAKVIDTIKDICNQRDKPSLENNLTSVPLAPQKESCNGTTSSQVTIQPVRPKIDLPQVDDLLRKRRRKSNPDGSDELIDETESSPASQRAGYFNSLSVTIPSLRNNRTSLGLNHSISIKPKISSSNSQAGTSILLSHEPTFVNQKRLINLSNSTRIIRLNTDQFSTGNNHTKRHDDVTNNSVSNDVSPDESNDAGLDFDPSNLLEQTMITDEAIVVSGDNNTNGSSKLEPMHQPLIDTQKFLTMCYHKDTDVFKCAICKNLYKTRKSMSRHFKEQHVQGPIFSCEVCNVSYKRREKLIKHAREKHLHDNMFPQYTE